MTSRILASGASGGGGGCWKRSSTALWLSSSCAPKLLSATTTTTRRVLLQMRPQQQQQRYTSAMATSSGSMTASSSLLLKAVVAARTNEETITGARSNSHDFAGVTLGARRLEITLQGLRADVRDRGKLIVTQMRPVFERNKRLDRQPASQLFLEFKRVSGRAAKYGGAAEILHDIQHIHSCPLETTKRIYPDPGQMSIYNRTNDGLGSGSGTQTSGANRQSLPKACPEPHFTRSHRTRIDIAVRKPKPNRQTRCDPQSGHLVQVPQVVGC